LDLLSKHQTLVKGRFPLKVVFRWSYRCLLVFVTVSILLVMGFRWAAPPLSSYMLQRYIQSAWMAQEKESMLLRYTWVPYGAISPHMALAVVAGEDQRFPAHWGFDFRAIQQVLEDKAQGKALRGASTISQQVAKNLFLWHGRSLLRKALEAWFTVLLELLWPKQRILEVYLNIIELGEQTFGVEAASRRFFNKSAQQLRPEEAALLAAVLPNPLYYRVNAPSAYVRERQSWILRQMRQLGGIDYLDEL